MEPKVLFEDESIVVVDKPSGMIVHDGDESLSAWLVNRYKQIANPKWPIAERAGIVHRLDKETSGVMVLSKNPDVLEKLQEQFKSHKTEKKYISLLAGQLTPERGVIDLPLSRHETGKTPMAVSHFGTGRGKEREATTEYKVLKTFQIQNHFHARSRTAVLHTTLVEAHPVTGRTHQLRVHFKAKGHPILGDPIYNTKESKRLTKELGIPRLFLHAKELSFSHPETAKKLTFSAPLPKELQEKLPGGSQPPGAESVEPFEGNASTREESRN